MSLIRSFVFLCIGFTATLHAQYRTSSCPPPKPICHSSHATRGGDWFTRLRALYVLPNDSSGSINTILSSGVSVNPSWTGEFDVGVMFTRNLGLELILSTCCHTLMGKKALSGTKIGTTWLLPPTLTFQWRFFSDSIVQPYVGAGANYTLFYSNHCSLPDTSLRLSHSWGPAVQGGIDFFFFQDWLFNLDAKYVWIDTKATLSHGTPGRVSVDINPWMFGFGIGRKW